MEIENIVIVSAARTPIGRYLGALREVPAVEKKKNGDLCQGAFAGD